MNEAIPIPEKYTRPRKVSHWGQDYDVTPAVVDAVLGNGRQLIYFMPLDTRPDYYLIRIDSSAKLYCDEFYDDHLDDIYEAVTDQYSEKEREREYLEEDLREQGIEPTGDNTDLAENEDRLGWPVLSADSGCCWGHVCFLRRRRPRN